MIGLIAGNLCTLFATAADAASASRKTTKGVLRMQSLAQFLYGVGVLFLKGYSAAVQNAVSILRNFAAIRKVNSKAVAWTLVALGVALGLLFNNRGIVGLLPILANLEYSVAVFRFQDNERKLKISFLVCVALFCVFNAAIMNIVGAVSNIFVFVTTLLFVLRSKPAAEETTAA